MAPQWTLADALPTVLKPFETQTATTFLRINENASVSSVIPIVKELLWKITFDEEAEDAIHEVKSILMEQVGIRFELNNLDADSLFMMKKALELKC